MLKDIDFTIQGERALFAEYAKLIPLIEKHFADFDGLRAIIASGDRSAAFARINREFQEDCASVTKARAFVNSSNGMSVWLQLDITLQDPRPGCSGCIYFKHSSPVGEIDSFGLQATGAFEYTFSAENARAHVEKILAVTAGRLQQARSDIEKAQRLIEGIQAGIPYEFRDCIIEGRR